MDPIKEAFSRAKQDLNSLKEQFSSLSIELTEVKELLLQVLRQTNTSNSTIKAKNSTDNTVLTESLKNNNEFWAHKALKPHIYELSTRNDGVSTNSQTDKQSDTSLDNPPISTGKTLKTPPLTDITSLLNSLDSYKKDLRNKFKRLTKQEMLVFSTIYQLEEEGFLVDYPLISKKLSLSESSIRDYVQRILKKNILINKIKENNKKIYFSIPSEIKEIASLQTIIQLREI